MSRRQHQTPRADTTTERDVSTTTTTFGGSARYARGLPRPEGNRRSRAPLVQHHPQSCSKKNKSMDFGRSSWGFSIHTTNDKAHRRRPLRHHGGRRGRVLVGGWRHLGGAAARAVALGHNNRKACCGRKPFFGGRREKKLQPVCSLMPPPRCRGVWCCCALLLRFRRFS